MKASACVKGTGDRSCEVLSTTERLSRFRSIEALRCGGSCDVQEPRTVRAAASIAAGKAAVGPILIRATNLHAGYEKIHVALRATENYC
jgi:hypothetical protein